MEEKRNTLRQIVLAGIMAAVIFIFTYLLIIPLPQVVKGAYINLGDTAIYMTAYLINPFFAMFASGIGSALADLAFGSVIYIVPTFIIKGLMGFVAAKIARQGKFGAYAIACLTAGLIMFLGYGAYETALYGLKTALVSSVNNLIQYVCGVALALPFYAILPRIKKAAKL